MPTAMKSVVYRGGVVTFRIPAHWREEFSDVDGGTFYEDRRGSGTLRLKIITMTTPKRPQTDSAMDVLQIVIDALRQKNLEHSTQIRSDGNAVLKYEEASVEQGTELTIFYWVVANRLLPRHARVVTFSYTIRTKQLNDKHVRHDLEMLEAEIEAATFSPEMGVDADRRCFPLLCLRPLLAWPGRLPPSAGRCCFHLSNLLPVVGFRCKGWGHNVVETGGIPLQQVGGLVVIRIYYRRVDAGQIENVTLPPKNVSLSELVK